MFIFDVSGKNYKTGGKVKMRNAEKLTDKVLKAVERIARKEAEKAMLGGSLECATFWHQPKRPKKR